MQNERLKEKQGEHAKPTLPLTINSQPFKWPHQYITGKEVRELGKIPSADEIFLGIKRPWDDELILDETRVDLARPGVEHFFSIKKGEKHLVTIHVNDKPFKISRGNHTVSEIKSVGGVPQSHELEELIEGKLTPLDDNATVKIKGEEQFFSHVRDGSSS